MIAATLAAALVLAFLVIAPPARPVTTARTLMALVVAVLVVVSCAWGWL